MNIQEEKKASLPNRLLVKRPSLMCAISSRSPGSPDNPVVLSRYGAQSQPFPVFAGSRHRHIVSRP